MCGRLCGIGIAWAQEQAGAKTVLLSADQRGAQHIRQGGNQWAGLTVRTPWCEASARDSGALGGIRPVRTDTPARDAAQAGRWARGLLLAHNRQAEQLRLNTELDIGMTAMARVDVQGGTGADGAWLVDEAAHDLVNGKTQTTLLRCVYSVQ
jgi:hypothetical protein